MNDFMNVPLWSICACNNKVLPEDTPKDKLISYVDISNVSLASGITGVTEYKFEKAPSRARRLVEAGDIIVSTVRTYLKSIAYIDANNSDRVFSTGFAVLHPKRQEISSFLKYAIQSDTFISKVIEQSKGVSYPAINATDLLRLKVLIPKYEAHALLISQWLDSKCRKIDNLLEQIRRHLDLLSEYKQSLITQAVTKGLDPNAGMKDVNFSCLPHIPVNWSLTKVFNVLSQPITDGPHETPIFTEDGIPFISAEAVSSGVINFEKMRGYISQAYYEECCKKYIPQKGDVYIIKSGATTGRSAMVQTDEIFQIWSPLAALRAKKEILLPDFLLYLTKSSYFVRQIQDNWSFGTQQNIGMRVLENLSLALPPMLEQESIVSFLNKKCSEIDSTVRLINDNIRKLQEYRSSLISAAVTGKIDIHEVTQ